VVKSVDTFSVASDATEGVTMRRSLRWIGVVLFSGLLLTAGVAPNASASVPAITKPAFVAKANAICTAGNAKLDKAGSKLGSSPSDKQLKAFVLGVFIPNVAGQIAAIRKLGFPAADKAELDATLKEASAVLAGIKKDPTSVLTATTSPFAAVDAKLSAYGVTECASGGDSSDSDPVTAAQKFVGHYQGPWNNTTFGSSGTVDLTITLDTTAKTLKTVTTITGNVFGAAPPPTETLTIPLPASATTPVTVTSPTFGAITFTLEADGSLVADAPNVPSTNAATFNMVLHLTATGIDGTYTVKLRSGSTANGTLALKKV
jgi:hypothetical protein